MRGCYKTGIERRMANALMAESIEFIYGYPIRCKYGYIIDFAIPDKKIAIECDGEPWHGGIRDEHRDGYLSSHGWTVLRFWGKEITDDIDSCVNRVKEAMV